MQRLMKIFHLIICHFSSFLYPFLKVLDPDISLFEPIMHLRLHPLILPFLPFHDLILFLELLLNFLLIIL